MAKLIEIEGLYPGREYPLGEATVFGRRLDTDIRITDRTVSRRHAKITETSKGFVIVDLDSGNGTILNGRRIVRTMPLRDGDRVRIGRSVFIFCDGEAPELLALAEDSVYLVESSAKTESTVIAAPDLGRTPPPRRAREASDRSGVQERLRQALAMAESLQNVLDLRRLLPQLLEDLFRVFPSSDRGLIMLQDQATGELLPVAAKSREGGDEAQMRVSKTIVNEVREGRNAVLSADAMSDKRFGSKESVAGMHIRSVMCVPFLRDKEFLGLVYLDTSRAVSKFSKDDLHLLTGIASQAALAIQNARVYNGLLRRKRIEQDLQVAQELQKRFLPEKAPDLPGFEFSAWYGAALEVGGDFYDFIERPDGRLGLAVGDVSGKGLPAALMMAKLMSDVLFFAMSEKEPRDVLTKLNGHISASRAAQGRFITLIYAVLDPDARTLRIANAGHPAPLIRKGANGDVLRLDETVSPPLGVVRELRFEQQVCLLQPGDTVAVFTDGVTEAMDARREPFGAHRLQLAIEKSPPSPKAVMEQILVDINEFVGLASPSDDLTLVCFGRTA